MLYLKFIILIILITIVNTLKKHTKTNFIDFNDHNVLQNGYIDWDCASRLMAQNQCMNVSSNTEYSEINVINAYMEDYATSMKQMESAVSCFYNNNPQFWSCVESVFHQCIQDKYANIYDYYTAYEKFSKLPRAFYTHECVCKMTKTDVDIKNEILEDCQQESIQKGNYQQLRSIIESYGSDNNNYLKCVLSQIGTEEQFPDNFTSVLNKECVDKYFDKNNPIQVKELNQAIYKAKKASDWVEFKELIDRMDTNSDQLMQCIVKNIPTISEFKNPFNDINNCKDYIDKTSKTEMDAYDELQNKSLNDSNWIGFNSDYQNYKSKFNSKLQQCIEQYIPEIQEFSSPFDSLNKDCLNLYYSTQTNEQLEQLNKLINASKTDNNWVEFNNDFENGNYDLSDPIFSCIKQQIPQINNFPKDLSNLDNCQTSLDTSDKNEIILYNEIIKKSQDLKNSLLFQQLLENYKDKISQELYQCLQSSETSQPSYPTSSPFNILNNQCLKLSDLEQLNEDQLNEVQKFVDNTKNLKNWVDFSNYYNKNESSTQNSVIQCMKQDLPKSTDFTLKTPFDTINSCDKYIDTTSLSEINSFNSLKQSSGQDINWFQFKADYEKQKNNFNVDLQKCIEQQIPSIPNYPQSSLFNSLNDKCLKQSDLQGLKQTELDDVQNFINNTENLNNWVDFSNYYNKNESSSQNSVILCIKQDLPKSTDFTLQSPFDTINSCDKYIDTTSLSEINSFNSLKQKSLQDKNWIDFKADYQNEKNNFNAELQKCIEQQIPQIKDFKSPFDSLNKLCLGKYLNTSDKNQITKLDQLVDSTSSDTDWVQFKQDFQNGKYDLSDQLFKCINDNIPVEEKFKKPFEDLNQCLDKNLDLSSAEDIQNSNGFVKIADQQQNWQQLEQQFQKYTFKQDNLKQCVKQQIPVILQLQKPFQDLNDQCFSKLDLTSKKDIEKYNEIVKQSQQQQNWQDFRKNVIDANSNDNSQWFQCIKSSAPPAVEQFTKPFDYLNNKCKDLLVLTDAQSIKDYDQVVEFSKKSKNWADLQNLLKGQNSKIAQCFLGEIPVINQFGSPFQDLNQCAKQIDISNIQQIKDYNKIITDTKSSQDWQSFKQIYDKEKTQFKCITDLIPKINGKFEEPFTDLNQCLAKIDPKSRTDIDNFQKFLGDSKQMKNWQDMSNYKFTDDEKQNSAFFKCIISKIPVKVNIPFNKPFDVLNSKCGQLLDLTSLKEIEEQADLANKVNKDSDWSQFAIDFNSLNKTESYGQNSAYFNCISKNIPLPKIEQFKKPFLSLNSCYYYLEKNFEQYQKLNSLVEASYKENPADWEQFNNDFKKLNLNSKENQQLPIFECIKKKIPIIEYFKEPLDDLNDQCIKPYLDKSDVKDIEKLNSVIDAQKTSDNVMLQYQSYIQHKFHFEQQQQQKNMTQSEYQKSLNFTDIDEKYKIDSYQQKFQDLMNTLHQLKLQKSQNNKFNPQMYSCFEQISYQKILQFKKNEFLYMNDCLPDLDISKKIDIELLKNFQEQIADDSNYNQVWKEFEFEGLHTLKDTMWQCMDRVIQSMLSNKKATGTIGGLYLLALL